MTKHYCKQCGVLLIKDNWRPSFKKRGRCCCIPCDKQSSKDRRTKIRLETIAIYGGKCACCDCDTPEFLTIDHIDETGAEHRRTLAKGKKPRGGTDFYYWLKKNDFPKDNFQLLCMNCNTAKHFFGVCPHQKK